MLRNEWDSIPADPKQKNLYVKFTSLFADKEKPEHTHSNCYSRKADMTEFRSVISTVN